MERPSETITDIIAEKRRRAEEIERDCAEKMKRGEMVSDRYARELVADIRREADRLEAAHKRERGDCAKLREALKATLDLFWDIHNLNRSPQSNQAHAVIRQIKAALAAPARNCDIHTDFNDALRTLANERNWHDGKWNSERYCILASWLLALAATEKEGGAK